MAFYAVLGIVLWIFLAFWPAMVAKRKGHSFVLYFVLSIIVSWLIMLIFAYAVKDKTISDSQRKKEAKMDAEIEQIENN